MQTPTPSHIRPSHQAPPLADRFPAKTWIHLARLLITAPLALFSLTFGLLFWTGTLTDAHNQPRPAAGPPMVTIGLFLLATAALTVAQLLALRTPLIRCFRDGIECNLVGATSLDGLRVPPLLRLLWSILSLQGFRSHRARIPWQHFRGADVAGLPAALLLRLHGTATNPRTGATSDRLTFAQHTLKTHPGQIADALNTFARSPASRQHLPPFPTTG